MLNRRGLLTGVAAVVAAGLPRTPAVTIAIYDERLPQVAVRTFPVPSQIRGYHTDMIIIDDPMQRDSWTQADVERFQLWYHELIASRPIRQVKWMPVC